MASRFNVYVKDVVTYYWRMYYVPGLRTWVPGNIIQPERVKDGGPSYGVSFTTDNVLYDPTGLTTGLGATRIGGLSASFVGMSASGCPGVGFMRTTFTAPRSVGLKSWYTITIGGVDVLSGIITTGGATSRQPPFVPQGNLAACSSEDGITGGNT